MAHPIAIPTGDVLADNQPLVTLAQNVQDSLARRGITVEIGEERLATPEYADIPDGHTIPDFMTDGSGVAGKIMDGRDPFDFRLRESGAGEANSEGRSLFTAEAVRENWSVDDVVGHLVESGQFEAARIGIADYVRSGVDPANVVAWAVVTYYKGVAAERIITSIDRFTKAGVSNDQAGQDVYDRERPSDDMLRQVKCVTHDERVDGYLYYQVDCRGNLWVGDELKDVAGKVADEVDRVGDARCKGVEIPNTLTYRTHTHYKADHRPHVSNQSATYRYIDW